MKNILLDFGNVLFYPTTGNWFISPYFENYIKEHGLNKELIINSLKGHHEILDRCYSEMEAEVQMFYEYFTLIFNQVGIKIDDDDLKKICRELTYSTDKYQMFDGVREELEELSNHNRLYLLSDNWPCGEYIMDQFDLSKYFEKIYISSYYGIKKDVKGFFQKPIYDFNLSKSSVVFVDDLDYPLETATSMGITSFKMDRYKVVKSDKYPVINNLFELKKHI